MFDLLRSNVAPPKCIAQFLMAMGQFDVPHPHVDDTFVTLMIMDFNLMKQKIQKRNMSRISNVN